MADSSNNFWSTSARGPYRTLMALGGVLMFVGSLAFLVMFIWERNWIGLAWAALLLYNGGGLLGLANSGRWWRFRRSEGK